jgi:hypothetical protein
MLQVSNLERYKNGKYQILVDLPKELNPKLSTKIINEIIWFMDAKAFVELGRSITGAS